MNWLEGGGKLLITKLLLNFFSFQNIFKRNEEMFHVDGCFLTISRAGHMLILMMIFCGRSPVTKIVIEAALMNLEISVNNC